MTVKNICLIGFKCCGKTAAGKLLAEKLGLKFLDNDDLMMQIHKNEKKESLSCREIHKKYGADYFRALEAKAIEKISKEKNSVIALGGGAVAYSANIELLKKKFTIVYLMDSPSALLERIKQFGIPAFLDPSDLEGSMRKELARREPLYEKYADVIVDCTGLSVSGIVKKVFSALK